MIMKKSNVKNDREPVKVEPENHIFDICKGHLRGITYNPKLDSSNVIIPEEIEEIDTGCFKDDQYVTSVILPKNLKIINSGAFANCHKLIAVKFNDKIERIGEYAFSRTMILGIELPDSVIDIGRNAFVGNMWMKSVTMSNNLYNKIKGKFFNYFPDTITEVIIHNIKNVDSHEDEPEYKRLSIRDIR